MMIIFWILIGSAIYYLVKNDGQAEIKNKRPKDAVDILKIRYANGEIDQETYTRTVEVLNN